MAASFLLLAVAFFLSQAAGQDNDSITEPIHGSAFHLPEVVGYDGWYNNPSHPEWGGADMQLSRRVPPRYSDSTYEPWTAGRPNPHEVATATMLGYKGLKSYQNRTALLTFFGQQVVEEILDAQRPGCPPEYFNIPIPTGHTLYDPDSEGGKELPFLRSRYDKSTGQSPNNPRQQLNEITPYIDGGLFYGVTKAWADALRSYTNGTMACADPPECRFPAKNTIGLPMANPPPPADHVLKTASRFYKLGNPRGNENPMLLAFGVIWFRNHNYHAQRLAKEWAAIGRPLNDELLFNRARQWVIAEHQNIVLNIWLPSFLGVEINPYPGYSTSTFPGITHAFQTSAMRFGHTLVPPIAYRAYAKDSSSGAVPTNNSDWKCEFRPLKPSSTSSSSAIRTCQSYWNSPDIITEGSVNVVDEILFGLSKQITEREDNIVTEDLRGFVFGSLDFSRRDLMAINIQRGRDHGVPDYNTVRQHYNLSRVTRYRDINPTMYGKEGNITMAIDNLMKTYTNSSEADANSTQYGMDNIDLWPGGLLETTETGPGELFRAIIQDQYERIRNSDRFWFENYRMNGLFTEEEVQTIRATTFRDIMIRNFKADWFQPYMLQQDVFRWNSVVDDPNGRCYTPFESYSDEQLTDSIEACSSMKTFDYFEGSAGPYIGTIISLGLYLLLNIALLVLAVKYQEYKNLKARSSGQQKYDKGRDVWANVGVFSLQGNPLIAEAIEEKTRHPVVVAPLPDTKQLRVFDAISGSVDRTIDLVGVNQVVIRTCPAGDSPGLVCVRFPNRYDLVLEFSTPVDDFLTPLGQYLGSIGVSINQDVMGSKQLLADIITESHRKELVEAFFRELFQDALTQDGGKKKTRKIFQRRKKERKEVLGTELTKHEFADAMGMKESSLFVEQVFHLVDKDKSGSISFKEYLQFVALFTNGSFDSKMDLMFSIYDLNGDGELSKEEFIKMLMLMAEEAGENIGQESIERSIASMIADAGLAHKTSLTVEDFKEIFGKYGNELDSTAMQIHGKTARKSVVKATTTVTSATSQKKLAGVSSAGGGQDETDAAQFRQRLATGLRADKSRSAAAKEARKAYASHEDEDFTSSIHVEPLPVDEELGNSEDTQKDSRSLLYMQRVWENYRLHIFWFALYQLVTLAIFGERAYYYSVEREHAGLRRIAGYGVTVTRGAASAMMFTYSSLLVTMSRNVITHLRETFLNRVIPFDAAHGAHKAFAMTALFYTVIHILGHCINFYHISTQTANDLTCLFREYYHLSDELPKFQFWMFSTLTGVTGYVLTLVIITMYVFALPTARRYLFNTFWFTHHLYFVLYALLILHGSGRLVQPPLFQWYFIGPALLFAADKLISISRKKTKIIVYKAEKLPSGVTHLQFKKPTNFNYLSGQWCRIACLALNSEEYHPFTLTSAPHEVTLDLYIRAVGPWTHNVRQVYDPDNAKNKDLITGAVTFPKLYLDGPFGEGHQDWYKFQVAVLVGGGIGVTPFASILKDLVFKRQANSHIACKKVYFLWVTRTQKQFEWLTDIIRQVEQDDKDHLTDIHIFITQFYQKFDL
eukprot:scpid15779/ scgid24724/ Dual oxidase 1